MDSTNKNEFTLSTKDFEIDETYDFDLEIDENTQLMLITELRERIDKYLDQELEKYYNS